MTSTMQGLAASSVLARVPAPSSSMLHAAAPPAPTKGTGKERALLDGVTLDRPFGAVSTILTNAIEHVTGYRDARLGSATQQVLLAGSQLVQATLRHLAAGKGIVAESSSFLSKVLPFAGIASGVMQVWQGWHELDSPSSPLDILGSRTARTGLLSIAASGLMFIPGVGSAIGGALLRIVAGANELDLFHSLDKPSHSLEQQGEQAARKVHVFDHTPTDAFDHSRRDAHRAREAREDGVPAAAQATASVGAQATAPVGAHATAPVATSAASVA